MSPLVALLLAAAPQVYFEQTTVTRVDGRLGASVHSRVWYAGRRARMEAGEAGAGAVLILRIDQGKAYRLDQEHQAVEVLDAESLRSRSHLDLSLAGDLLGGSEEGAARTHELPQRRSVAGHSCRGYRITAGSATLEVWASEEVPVGVEAFTDFLEWTGASQSLGALLTELKRVPGFPLETRSRVTVLSAVHETVSTVTAVRVGPIDPALFEPPPGWALHASPADR